VNKLPIFADVPKIPLGLESQHLQGLMIGNNKLDSSQARAIEPAKQ
jgi:hypothetical protein